MFLTTIRRDNMTSDQPGSEPKRTEPQYNPSPILRYFTWMHLPSPLAEVSRDFENLALIVDRTLPNGPEKSVALRKLLEAKDAAVRAAL